MSAREVRSDRSRVIAALVASATVDGYPAVKVGDLARGAGVTRARFYELFADKEECFLHAQRELGEGFVEEAKRAIAAAGPAGAGNAALSTLAKLAEREPATFALITHEATFAGARAWGARESMVGAIASELERCWRELPGDAIVPDLPATDLLTGAMRALGIRMRRSTDPLEQLGNQLIAWSESYSVPKPQRRWESLRSSAVALPVPSAPEIGPVEPAPLPRGRHRLPPGVAKRSQRERIMHATGRVLAKRGYLHATVADIVSAAGVSREVFYEHFHDKREAFAETIKFVFEQIMAPSAGAFFGTDAPWPERIWEACRVFVGFVVSRRPLAHPVFVEPYAVGPELQQGDNFVMGFTLFLEDGYRWRPEAAHVPRISGEAVGGTVLELINGYLRRGKGEQLMELVPLGVYVVLAPFMGAPAAHEFVSRKASEG
jgi:AcrR family transcriptional regulator